MKTALLIIDVQYAALTPQTAPLAQKIESLQKNYQTIFVSRFINNHSPLLKLLDWQGYDNQELAFVPAPHAKIFEKNIYSSFRPEMTDFEQVHLCGFDTDACVYKTALDLAEHRVRPVVLADYCGSASEKFHRYGLALLERNIGINNIRFGKAD